MCAKTRILQKSSIFDFFVDLLRKLNA